MSEIKEFFHDKCILITGATGFVGKYLLEKILFSCQPKRIYVLIRKKKGVSSDDRIKTFLSKEAVFQFRRLDRETLDNKLIAIDGDIENVNVFADQTEQDVDQILDSVQIVIHSAATVRFNQSFE